MISLRKLWIGLNDLEKEGEYRWHDGSLITWTSWQNQQPNNLHGNQDCVEIDRYDMTTNDNNCAENFHFICEVIEGK